MSLVLHWCYLWGAEREPHELMWLNTWSPIGGPISKKVTESVRGRLPGRSTSQGWFVASPHLYLISVWFLCVCGWKRDHPEHYSCLRNLPSLTGAGTFQAFLRKLPVVSVFYHRNRKVAETLLEQRLHWGVPSNILTFINSSQAWCS